MKQVLCAWLAAALLSGAGAQAQVAPGSQASVAPVATTGPAARFQVPQVKLPNAAVARRINQELLRLVVEQHGLENATASPRQLLTAAARECCYDELTERWRAGGNGLTELEYTVLLNQDYLLSVEFQLYYQGLNYPATQHLTFDLRTGNLLRVTDLLADSPLQLRRRLRAAVSRRLREELSQVAANYGDSATVAHVAELYQLANWNAAPARGLAEDLAAPDEDFPEHLEFALTPKELLLFHPVGMSRLDFEFLPDEMYRFPYERVQPKSLLVPIARKAGAPKPSRKK
ncbi:hypothetical protein [Hymenobacter jeollabukensis]|uniref:DUF3298 domain-containing protein n=1 Tax=Hymenobacter jeollabukensis TaxID=2025313 RepID=A0A5R8WNZ2_9BACT|nr:hypothetical protein [Hymenobacter jeollabukensis]TLM91797.1 hypothetical protein FDY95_14660 [Hymenobacter jeollabukensis]